MNAVQELQFRLMELASFNSFDGPTVVKDLTEHPELWRGAVMHDDRLMSLRDIPEGYWHCSTLHILPVAGREDELEALTKNWAADEVDWIGGEKACFALGEYHPELRANPRVFLRVWWD